MRALKIGCTVTIDGSYCLLEVLRLPAEWVASECSYELRAESCDSSGAVHAAVFALTTLYKKPGWTYVERIGAAAMDPLPLETAEDLYEEEDFAHLIIPGHLFLLMGGRLPTVPESSFTENGDVNELPSYYPREPPTYFLYIRNIEAFQEWRPRDARGAILQVVELQIVANIPETLIKQGLRICNALTK
ncbi:hypothetical protein DL771_010108 [Monosporascus sp. 5C6A]|nr:hypothetical protein DL771_010108 [Monosporascus sp. 5C6A]